MGLDLFHFIPVMKSDKDEYLEHFEVADFNFSPDYLERNKNFIVEYDAEELGFTSVIYVREIGYQSKGVNSSFYRDFENDKPYVELQSVKKAYHYLEKSHLRTLQELQQNFQSQFIKNFVVGSSIFCASW
jgi:intein-encoded DNA endonuclease-like protein